MRGARLLTAAVFPRSRCPFVIFERPHAVPYRVILASSAPFLPYRVTFSRPVAHLAGVSAPLLLAVRVYRRMLTFTLLALSVAAFAFVARFVRRTYAAHLRSGACAIRRAVAVARLSPRLWEPVDPDALYACELCFDGCGEVARWREITSTTTLPVYACRECRSRLGA